MIIIETPLRSKFALLDPELQDVLLQDLGFLTLETELEQQRFVEGILDLSLSQQADFLNKMKKKQRSKAYKDALEEFTRDYETRIVPSLDKQINNEMEKVKNDEQQIADSDLDSSLNEI